MNSIVGISGVRLKSENPYALAQWYRKHFGLTFIPYPDMDEYIALVPYRSLTVSAQSGYSFFVIKATSSNASAEQILQQAVTCRVASLQHISNRLLSEGVKVELEKDEFLGSCASLEDPEGNFIEILEEQSLVSLA